MVTHLLAFTVGEVTLSQHETTRGDVHLAPRTNQTHVLLQGDNTWTCSSVTAVHSWTAVKATLPHD